MKTVIFVLVAFLLILGALFFPSERIERQKASRLAELDENLVSEANTYTAEDDIYVDYVNHPYPISGSNIFRMLLFTDASILLLLIRFCKCETKPKPGQNRIPYRRVELIGVILLTLCGAVLRFAGASRNFWLDELATVFRYVRGSSSDILFQAVSSNNHLLNSLLAHTTAFAFGESELMVRLPAILFGIATIPVFYHFVRTLGTPRDAFMASSLLTFSYHHIYFSQNARGYTSMLLGVILSTHFLIRAFKTNEVRDWIFYVVSALLSILSVLFGLFIFASHVLCAFAYWLFRREKIHRNLLKRMLLAFGAVIYVGFHIYAFIVPDVLGFIFGEYQRAEVGWKFSSELLDVIYRGLALGSATTVTVVICGILSFAGFISYFKQEPFGTALLVVPIVFTLCVIIVLQVGIFPRYFVFALPTAFQFLSRGLLILSDSVFSKPQLKQIGYAASLLTIIAGSAWMLRPFYKYPMQDFTGAKSFIQQNSGNADTIVAVGTAAEGYRYYWPTIKLTHKLSEVHSLVDGINKTWLIYSFPQDMLRRRPRLYGYILQKFRLVRRFPATVGDADLYVMLYEPAYGDR